MAVAALLDARTVTVAEPRMAGTVDTSTAEGAANTAVVHAGHAVEIGPKLAKPTVVCDSFPRWEVGNDSWQR